MDSRSGEELIYDFGLFHIYKNNRIKRLHVADFLPPSDDPKTGVQSKDVRIPAAEPETNIDNVVSVTARLYLPKITNPTAAKLPIIVYIHGGAYCVESAFSSSYHPYLNSLAAQANAIAVSIEYRLAPEHLIPACYEDSWAVMQWVALHANSGKEGPEPWLNQYGDFGRVFLAGDSAGANIAHNMVVRASVSGLGSGLNIIGMVLIHPFFGNNQVDKLWVLICSDDAGVDDPRLNPAAHPGLLSKLNCRKVLVATAERDSLRKRAWYYYEALKNSGWGGNAEIVETEGEQHVFHLFKPTSDKARVLMNRVVSFINNDSVHSSL